mmetsp:Transcript_59736/g.158998  ORF Transcript_59736/g.158998 Transcript_59736/m.158998 type:complete len:267 (-) Transcript_59736:6-806(-)
MLHWRPSDLHRCSTVRAHDHDCGVSGAVTSLVDGGGKLSARYSADHLRAAAGSGNHGVRQHSLRERRPHRPSPGRHSLDFSEHGPCRRGPSDSAEHACSGPAPSGYQPYWCHTSQQFLGVSHDALRGVVLGRDGRPAIGQCSPHERGRLLDLGELCCGHCHFLLGCLGAATNLCHEFPGPREREQIWHHLRRGLLHGLGTLASVASVWGVHSNCGRSTVRKCTSSPSTERGAASGATESRGTSTAGMSGEQGSQDVVSRVAHCTKL